MTKNVKKNISERQKANVQILKKLHDYFIAYPDIRFGQALANLNIIEYDRTKLTPEVIDPFFEESADILEKVNKIVAAVGINEDGSYKIISGNYVGDAASIADAISKLDAAMTMEIYKKVSKPLYDAGYEWVSNGVGSDGFLSLQFGRSLMNTEYTEFGKRYVDDFMIDNRNKNVYETAD